MDKKEILDFITANPTHFLATAEDNKPHVRPFGTYRADDNGIIYFTQSVKDVYKQLVKNPEIETCYYAKDITLRVRGRLQPVEDMALKKEVVENRPFLKPQVEKNGWDYLKLFILKNAKATFHDRKTPLIPGAPKTWIDL
jgi:pyridoxamine 5'-phosphate oxidase